MSAVSQESQPVRSVAPKPPGPAGGDPLFGHLLASKPPKQRRIGVWLIAAALHIPLFLYAWFSQISPRIEAWQQEQYRTLIITDQAPPIVGPRAEAAPRTAEVAPPAPAPKGETRALPSVVTPGIPEPTAPVIVPPVAEPAGQPGGAVGGTGRSLKDRLSAPTNPTLFGRVEPSPPSGIESVRERVAGTIKEYNDSVAAVLAAAERATDWTVKDKDGKRWGVSPGKLHLGDITLPLPLAFQTPPGRRDEVNGRLRSYAEVEQGAARAELKESFEERVKAIRARKERERAEKKKPVTITNDPKD